jgi:hypothetical protein
VRDQFRRAMQIRKRSDKSIRFINLFKFLCKCFIKPYVAVMQIIELFYNVIDQDCCHNLYSQFIIYEKFYEDF